MPRSRRLPDPPEFFIDRSLGRHLVRDALEQAGYTAHTLASVYGEEGPQRVSDEQWIALAGRNDWVVLTIPSYSPPLRTLSADGDRLLLALVDSTHPNRAMQGIVLVDIENNTAEMIHEGVGGTFWAGDDRTAIVIVGETIRAIDTVSGETTTIDGAVPEGFFVIAGR